jgi:CheY-like chemotaxis protein
MACVLVVDDESHIRQIVRIALGYRGYQVVEAASGVECWRLLAEARPDLVILDIMMPGQNGLDVCRAIRADAQFAALPIIVLTAGGPEVGSDARAAGASAVMSKPFSPTALLNLVASLIAPS